MDPIEPALIPRISINMAVEAPGIPAENPSVTTIDDCVPAMILDTSPSTNVLHVMIGYFHNGPQRCWLTADALRVAGLPLYRGTRCSYSPTQKVLHGNIMPAMEQYESIRMFARDRLGMPFATDLHADSL